MSNGVPRCFPVLCCFSVPGDQPTLHLATESPPSMYLSHHLGFSQLLHENIQLNMALIFKLVEVRLIYSN